MADARNTEGHHPLHKGTMLTAMGNEDLPDRLHRVLELITEAGRHGWDAMGRDLALDELKAVYAQLHGVRLMERPAKEAQIAVISAADTLEANLTGAESEPVTDSHVRGAESLVMETTVAAEMEPSITGTAPVPAMEWLPIAAPTESHRYDETDPVILAERLNRPLPDLRTGIPLNEKFGLIKNLFANSATDFQDTILHLNCCTDVQGLMVHLDELRSTRGWDVEDVYYLQLLSCVERKGRYLVLSGGR